MVLNLLKVQLKLLASKMLSGVIVSVSVSVIAPDALSVILPFCETIMSLAEVLVIELDTL